MNNDNDDLEKSKNYGGVIYEPSAENINFDDEDPKSKIPMNVTTRKKNYPRPEKSQFLVFYLITILVGVIVCLVVLAIVFSFFSGSKEKNVSNGIQNEDGINIGTEVEDTEDLVQFLGAVERVNINANTLTMFDVNTNKQYTLLIQGSPDLRDRFGQRLILSEIRQGDIADVEFNVETNILKSFNMSSKIFENRLVQNVIVIPEDSSIQIGANYLEYDQFTIVTRNGDPVSIESITPLDVVTIRGINGRVISIDITKGSGTIEIINEEEIENGRIEINTDIFMQLGTASSVDVAEGDNRIVVRGDNIEPFIREVTIQSGESYILDLSETQRLTGTLIVSSTPQDILFYIDDEFKNANEPITLEFGIYKFRAEKFGYETLDGEIIIGSAVERLTINLEEIAQKGRVILNTVPGGGQIFINGNYIGEGPVTVDLQFGAHTIRATKEGYEDFVMNTTITERRDYPFNITLTPKATATAIPQPVPTIPAAQELPFIELD